MKNFIDFILTENYSNSIHKILNDKVLDSDTKYKNIQNLIDDKKKTGILNNEIMKGSSRAVITPSYTKDKNMLKIDGEIHHVPVVHKIAYKGTLDDYTDDNDVGFSDGKKRLLGHLQNEHESSKDFHPFHIIQKENDGFKYNPNGFLSPVMNNHNNFHHIEMMKVEPYNHHDFGLATRNKDFPNGFSASMISNLVYNHVNALKGKHEFRDKEFEEQTFKHPLINGLLKASATTTLHPGDLHEDNWGIWTHPKTGEMKPVLLDYGISKDLLNTYIRAKETRHSGYKRP